MEEKEGSMKAPLPPCGRWALHYEPLKIGDTGRCAEGRYWIWVLEGLREVVR